jgi:hypothetical protein
MNKRTRVFVLVASAVLLIGIGTAGVASWVGLGNLGILAQGGTPELAYIPPDAKLLAFVDVRHVMDSELRHKLQPNLSTSPQSSKLVEEFGINLETDIDTVVAAVFDTNADAKGEAPLVIARGRFNASQIEAAVRSRGGSAQDYRGSRLVTASGDQMAVALVSSGLVALGAPAAVRFALDTQAAGGSNITDNDQVMRLVHKVDNAPTWTVAQFDVLQDHANLPANVASQLPSITWFAAGGQIDAGVKATIHAEARDEKAAQHLREVIKGFVALVRMQVGQQPEFADLVNSVELSGEGTTVSLGFSVPAEMIDRLGASTPRLPVSAQPVRPVRPAPARVAVHPSI